MSIFGQRDYNVELGTGTGATIAAFGCAETCVASLLVNCFGKNTDPIQLNNDLIKIGGYASNGAGAFDLIEWEIISKLYPDVSLAFNNTYPSNPADMNIIDPQLAKGCSVIAGVSFNHNPNDSQPSHYIEIYKKNSDGSYQCRDPWYKDDTSFNDRYAVNGMSVAQCILQAISYNGPVQEPGTYVDATTFQRLVANSTEYDKFNSAGYKTVDDVIKKVGDLTNENTGLKTQISECNTQNASLADQIKKMSQSDSTAIDTGVKAEKDLNSANQTISSIAGALKTSSDLKSMLSAIDTLQSGKVAVIKIKDLGKIMTWLLKNGINF